MVIKKKKYSDTSVVVTLRMPNELVEKIDNVSHLTNRTRNEIITRCIDFALDHIEIEGLDKDKND